ncbi:unnamed protein product [Angiostrongylus costaricensis]|uniref:SP-RING-type domain-containing protein n=1 Tax=Angiostrongylus costaricensis TaxID=334426 RepID=A0A158PES0_ANGCS|nr:unnamed protein product [Angiostrongylus costaricensis]
MVVSVNCFRFFQLPQNYASEELADDFPLNCVVRIEDQLVQLPSIIPTNKPNVEPKRPSRPVDITQNCMSARDPTRPLRLMVEWTGDKRTWVVAVYLVSEFNHWQEEHVTRDLIRARLIGSSDDDIAMAQLKISLLCPLSRTRITLPGRCKNCSHLQCFDLFNYLLMNEKRPTWRCPVCSDWAPFKNIIIDGYFKTILASVDKEAVEVELLVDGSYRTVKSECIDVDDDDIPSMSAVNSTMKSNVLSNHNPSSSKTKTNVDDIIVLSDSDDDEEQQVDQAIRRSLTETGPMGITSSPRSRDSSIIILDDESPPVPTTTSIQNTVRTGGSLTSILFFRRGAVPHRHCRLFFPHQTRHLLSGLIRWKYIGADHEKRSHRYRYPLMRKSMDLMSGYRGALPTFLHLILFYI